ncbi:MAG: D-2-hydroxyacid dehydrogenase, partial [Bacteroidota bacterium]
MTIVVLDGFTLNPGDLSWRALQDLGECQIYDRTPVEEIVPRASGAEIVLTNKTPLSGETIAGLPLLRYIGVLATGHNIVDSDATHQRGIPVSNVPAYGTASVTQM